MTTKIFKAISTVLIISVGSKVIGFVRDIFHAKEVGTTAENDAYFFAFSITYIVITILMVSINTTFIPIISKAIKDSPENEKEVVKSFLSFYLFMGIILYISIYLSSPIIVSIFAVNFDSLTQVLTIKLVRYMSLSVIIIGYITIGNSLLQLNKKYLLPAMTGYFPSLLIILVTFVFNPPQSIIYISLSNFIGRLILLLLILLLNVKKYRYSLVPNLRFFSNVYLKNSLVLLIPVLIGTTVQQIDILVSRFFATSLEVGSLSAFSFANRITLMGVNLIAYAITIVIYPYMSKLVYKNNKEEFNRILSSSFFFLIMIFIPISYIIFVHPYNIVVLLFQRGEFDQESTMLTVQALKYLAIAMFPLATREILNKAFYSYGDTYTPMILSVISIVINIVLSFVWIGSLGLIGITLAYSVSTIILILLLIYFLHKKRKYNYNYGGSKELIKLLLTIFLSIIIHTTVLLFMNLTQYGYLNEVFLSTLTFILIYLILLGISRNKLLYSIITKILRRKNI